MIKLSLTFAFLFGMMTCFGKKQFNKDTSKFKNTPLFIIKVSQLASLTTTNAVINPSDIDSINVFKYPFSENLYGNSGNNGVVVIVLKPRIRLINFDDLLASF